MMRMIIMTKIVRSLKMILAAVVGKVGAGGGCSSDGDGDNGGGKEEDEAPGN